VIKYLLGIALLGLAACASTRLIVQWTNPSYDRPPIEKLLVVGVIGLPGPRRVFEDELVVAFRAAGVEAVPSYTVIEEDGQATKVALRRALRETATEGVLVTRLVDTASKIQLAPRDLFAAGLYDDYSATWVGYYSALDVYPVKIVTSETSLYGPGAESLIWSGTAETFGPNDIRKETRELANLVIDALRAQGIL